VRAPRLLILGVVVAIGLATASIAAATFASSITSSVGVKTPGT
jgi:hypothetical protein